MHKILVLYPKGQDEKKFTDHYESKHIPLAKKLPGLLACRFSYDIKGNRGAESPYFCIFEAEFADEAAMVAAMTSPAGAALAADVVNYVTVPPVIVNYKVAG